MTTQELINYYANLLILQYIGKPNAYATVKALVSPVVMDQLPTLVQNAFNLNGANPAVGVQLDVIGKYVGVTRNGFTLKGAPISLSDSDFLSLIQMAIVTNSEGSDLGTIQQLLNFFFPGEVFVFDYQNMHMSYLINTSVGSQNLIQLFITEGLLPKPMGVALAAPIFNSNLIFFGMVDARDVYTYSVQNSVSVNVAANAVATGDHISPFNDSTAPITGEWLNAQLGVSLV